ncbi:hypothetical protein F511_11777 [Dorcoceras hygrometricum]|uniref:Uncharacterized protein n=1 Tax=Dorcoceras hygrometricum TaxID=472368 RepID=A0A2Z7CH20_9LAMI|nr:hypothetical protein F511_11777 [Dorcoceras hygrometricum]
MSSPDYDLVVRSAESIDHSSTPEVSNREDENVSLTDNYRARILRIDQDEARLTALGCSCKEKRKASPEKKERRRKRRHEERGTGSTQESIPEVEITEPVDTSNKGPEPKPTEEPYSLLDLSTLSFVSKPSGASSMDFIRHMVPEHDYDQLKKTPDLEVFEAAGLHFMQSLTWFGEAASRFSKAHAEVIKTKRSYDGVLGRHEALLKQLEEIQTKGNVEKEYLTTELEAARAEAQIYKSQAQSLETQVQSLEIQVQSLDARARCVEEEGKLRLAEVERKAAMYFDKGFEGCLAEFRVNGYPEEEHPASFLVVEHAFVNMPEDPVEDSSGHDGTPPA